MDNITKPLLKFRVYVRAKHGPKTPFFWCSIWRNIPQMRAHSRDIQAAFPGIRNARSCLKAFASCYSWAETETHELGILLFAMPYTGASTIAHECTHAAFRYCPTVKGRHTADYLEEMYACVVGEMSQQIVKRLTVWDRKRAKRG